MHDDALKTGQDMAADWDARAEDNARYFIAERYDDADFRASGEREAEQVLLNDVVVPPEATVLEIGCGIGRLLRPMAARFQRVIGFDVSAKMIEQSHEYLADCKNVETYANDGSTLPGIADNSVDFCYSFICFQHIPRKEFIASYLREALRVLKAGGVFKFQVDGQTWPERLTERCRNMARRVVYRNRDTSGVRRSRVFHSLRYRRCHPASVGSLSETYINSDTWPHRFRRLV